MASSSHAEKQQKLNSGKKRDTSQVALRTSMRDGSYVLAGGILFYRLVTRNQTVDPTREIDEGTKPGTYVIKSFHQFFINLEGQLEIYPCPPNEIKFKYPENCRDDLIPKIPSDVLRTLYKVGTVCVYPCELDGDDPNL